MLRRTIACIFAASTLIYTSVAEELQRSPCNSILLSNEVQSVADGLTDYMNVVARSGAEMDDLFKRFKEYLTGRLNLSQITPREKAEAVQAATRMQPDDVKACFPRMMPAFRIAAQNQAARLNADERKQQRLQAEVDRKKQEEDDLLNKRVDIEKLNEALGTAYIFYLYVRRCHEAREGYSYVFVSDVELARAQQKIKSLEDRIRVPAMSIDFVWARANKIANEKLPIGSTPDRNFCQTALGQLEATHAKWVPESAARKKDF